jgi:two-component system sensor histidine kinase YesM
MAKKIVIRKRKSIRLHKKLMVSYLVACIFPMLIASFIIYNFAVNNLEEASLEFASILNSQIITTIDNFTDDYNKLTKSVLVDESVITRFSNESKLSMSDLIDNQFIMQKNMMRIMTLKPDIKCIMLISPQSTMYTYTNSNENVNLNKLIQEPWYNKIMGSGGRMVIVPIHNRTYIDNQNGGTAFTVGRVILNSNGGYAGIMLIDLDPTSLVKLNDNFLTAKNKYNIKFKVTTSDGDPIYDSDATNGSNTWENLANNYVNNSENKNESDFIFLSNKSVDGKLTVSTEIPRSKLQAKIMKIKYVTFFAILLCILFIIIVSILLSYNITKPVEKLQKSMKLAEEGNYNSIIEGTPNDEIGDLIISYNNMITKIKALIEDVYIAEIKQKNAKFLALQTQINPHMLYNTLESIRMKAIVKGEDEVAVMIKILSRMFRLMLGKDSEHNKIRNELDYASNYIQLQNIRFNNSFFLQVTMSEEVQNASIIALVFQPIIENSIKHGFVDYNKPLNILIEGEITEENDIVIKISDNGVGMLQETVDEINQILTEVVNDNPTSALIKTKSEASIGLKNIAERIRLHYGDNYFLKVASNNDVGTVVELKIPYKINRTQ